jgi:AcrR family transcriptional regulator
MSKKNAILLAATELFSQKGYEGASMAELSRMTGAAGGTIFHHFKNKTDLFAHILAEIKQAIVGAFERYLAEANYTDGLKQVEGAVTYYLQLAEEMQNRFLILHRHFPYKIAETNPVCREHLVSIYDRLLDIFENGIRRGQMDGSIHIDSARQGAMILFSMVDGIARFNTYKLYDAGTLYGEVMVSCRKILKAEGTGS